jgi:hypothetical protein
MKYSVECLWLRLAVLGIVMSLLSACATVSSKPVIGVCPPVVEYSQAEQVQAAGEIEALPDGAVLIDWLADYSLLRQQIGSCGT